jgi:hypothetical protein
MPDPLDEPPPPRPVPPRAPPDPIVALGRPLEHFQAWWNQKGLPKRG